MTNLDRYTCEEAFRRIDDYVDRQLAPDEMELVREHLVTCAACAHEFRFEASLLHGVKEKLRHIDLPNELQARILAGLQRAEGSDLPPEIP